MSGDADLRRIIAKVKRIPHLVKETAGACAESFDAAVNAALAAGHGPSGEAWPRLKEGSGAPLENASGNATLTRAVGTTIITTAQHPYQFHDRGARGGKLPIRKVVPSALSAQLAEAIKRPLVQAFNRKIKGA